MAQNRFLQWACTLHRKGVKWGRSLLKNYAVAVLLVRVGKLVLSATSVQQIQTKIRSKLVNFADFNTKKWLHLLFCCVCLFTRPRGWMCKILFLKQCNVRALPRLQVASQVLPLLAMFNSIVKEVKWRLRDQKQVRKQRFSCTSGSSVESTPYLRGNCQELFQTNCEAFLSKISQNYAAMFSPDANWLTSDQNRRQWGWWCRHPLLPKWWGWGRNVFFSILDNSGPLFSLTPQQTKIGDAPASFTPSYKNTLDLHVQRLSRFTQAQIS